MKAHLKCSLSELEQPKKNAAWLSRILLVLAIIVPMMYPQTLYAVVYVDTDSPGPTHDGLSWNTAYLNLQDALVPAVAGSEIWVAEGIYYPDEGTGQTDNNRMSTFELKSNVSLYGGFAGSETARSQRDWVTHLTVLSGNITGNDMTDSQGVVHDWEDIVEGTSGPDNAYNVVYAFSVSGAVLDGFTITGGSIDDSIGGFDVGAGVFTVYGSPVLRNLTVIGNLAITGAGGGIYLWEGSPQVDDSIFIGNASCQGGGLYVRLTAASSKYTGLFFQANDAHGTVESCGTGAVSGGGMYSSGTSYTFDDVQFFDNTAVVSGGGMETYDPMTLTNAMFQGNHSDKYGGGLWDGGYSTLSDVDFVDNSAGLYGGGVGSNGGTKGLYSNVNFYANHAGTGGGLYMEGTGITLVNSTVAGNMADSGGGIWKYTGSLDLNNVVVSGNMAGMGAGIFGYRSTAVTMKDVTFSGNKQQAIASYSTSWLVDNTILWNNTGGSYNDLGSSVFTASHCTIEGGCPSGGTCDSINTTDPDFVDPIDPAAAPTCTGDLRLLSGSLAINAGSNALLPADVADVDGDSDSSEPLPLDLDHHPRVVTTTVDHGAFEFGTTPAPPPPMADGKQSGRSARFSRSSSTIGQIDVTFDIHTCSAARAVILYGNIGDFSGYVECARADAGPAGLTTIDATGLDNVWFNIIWVNETIGGHPGFAWNGSADVPRAWFAEGFCGLDDDDQSDAVCD